MWWVKMCQRAEASWEHLESGTDIPMVNRKFTAQVGYHIGQIWGVKFWLHWSHYNGTEGHNPLSFMQNDILNFIPIWPWLHCGSAPVSTIGDQQKSQRIGTDFFCKQIKLVYFSASCNLNKSNMRQCWCYQLCWSTLRTKVLACVWKAFKIWA